MMSAPRSLRARLVAGTIAGITLFLAADGVLVYVLVKNRLVAEVDRSLESIAKSLVATVNIELGRRLRDGAWRVDGDLGIPATAHEVDALFQCWFEDGTEIVRSVDLGNLELPRLPAGAETAIQSIEMPDGSPGRAVSLSILPGPDPARETDRPRRARDGERPPPRRLREGVDPERRPGVDRPPRRPDGERRPLGPRARLGGGRQRVEIVAARDLGTVETTLRDLRSVLLITWLAASAGCAAIVWGVVALGLRPVGRLRSQLSKVDERRLDHRFEVDRAPSELVPVVDQLNAFLARIQEAFSREQTFAAHAAHELRTPLAGLRSTLEVTASRPREAEEYREAIGDCLAITIQMQSVVEALLELARPVRTDTDGAKTGVSLASLVTTAWGSFATEAASRKMHLVSSIDAALRVRTDERLLTRIVTNLIANAISHGDAESDIRVEAQPGVDGTVDLIVMNGLANAPDEIAERAFDAFWRAETSRTSRAHAGLGLAICKRIANALELDITVEHEAGHFKVRLRGLPTL